MANVLMRLVAKQYGEKQKNVRIIIENQRKSSISSPPDNLHHFCSYKICEILLHKI